MLLPGNLLPVFTLRGARKRIRKLVLMVQFDQSWLQLVEVNYHCYPAYLSDVVLGSVLSSPMTASENKVISKSISDRRQEEFVSRI